MLACIIITPVIKQNLKQNYKKFIYYLNTKNVTTAINSLLTTRNVIRTFIQFFPILKSKNKMPFKWQFLNQIHIFTLSFFKHLFPIHLGTQFFAYIIYANEHMQISFNEYALTNPYPRLFPVCLSVITTASSISPNLSKNSRSDLSESIKKNSLILVYKRCIQSTDCCRWHRVGLPL